ncbi:MAG: hypothetical protein Q8S73_34205 [Deltaproteobacteria bacterium]|nr:hypothetical protein [Deltaproteobacteria bacterium]
MFDYPAIRAFYFNKGAEKCARDPSGEGRFESAFYHTIKMVHDSVSAENAERIALLEADIKTLNAALVTTSEGNAQLLTKNAQLKQAQGEPVGWVCADGTPALYGHKPLAPQTKLYTSAATIPAGWQLVPVEPTFEMMDGAFEGIRLCDAHTTYGVDRHVWAHMLAHAPKPGEPA